jgi:adenylate cyclase
MYLLRTLGGLSVELDGVVQDKLGAQRRTLALLTILAVSGGRGISRDRVATYLWPESDMERSRGALKQALYTARRLFSPEVILGTSELRLNDEHIRSDVDAFLRALEEDVPERAVEVYGGPFLDGFYLRSSADFEQWVSLQRDDLARRYTAALEQLARATGASGDQTRAVGYWRRLQAENPLSARITLGLMAALEAAGERSAAIRCAELHEVVLREELGSPPDHAVVAAAARLREAVPAPPVPAHPGYAPRPTPPAGEVRTFPGAGDGPAPGSRPVRSVRTWLHRAVVLLAVIGLASWTVGRYFRGPASAGGTPDRSIAVLPFVNTDGDPLDEHLSDGLTDELIGVLGKLEGLRVTARTSTFALKGKGLSVPAIADTLRVATVLEGTVRREGDRLKVTAQLVNAADGGVLWAGSYNRALIDMFAVQDEITRAVAGALLVEVPPGDGNRLVHRPTEDPEAYDLYLQGRHRWTLPTRERLERADILYRRAVERDPAFALAYAGLAETYVALANFAYMQPTQALARAKVAAEHALELDPTLAEAYVSYGAVLASELDFERAEAAFQRALALNPNYAWGHHYYSLLLAMIGRMDDAAGHNRQAIVLDPLSLPASATRAILTSRIGDPASAEREFRRALALAPNYVVTLRSLGSLKAATGAFAEALPLLEAAATDAPDFAGLPGALALVYHRTGRRAEADSLLAAVEAAASTGGRTRANLALAYAALGRLDAAFALLEQLDWDVATLIFLQTDPLLGTLRSDPRYPPLLRRIGIPGHVTPT